MVLTFEFDDRKSLTNLLKHGLSFEKATELWQSDAIQLDATYRGEQRFLKIGQIDGKMFTCIFTKRDEKIRLISCRRSRKNEETKFKKKQKDKTNFSRGIRQEI